MQDAAKCGKEENFPHVYLSSTTASLKCRRILFVCSKELRKDVEDMWNAFILDAKTSYWRNICFPVEDSQIFDGAVENLLSTVSKCSTKLRNRVEVVLCTSKSHSGRSKLENICQKNLQRSFYPITLFIEGQDKLESSDKCIVFFISFISSV
jgi:hypothetical protein